MANLDFELELPVYRGPIDLLWHLVRKSEVDIASLSVADITRQYVEFVEALVTLQVDQVGEFIDFASQLVEYKSRAVLPNLEGEELVVDDPTEELVERLLEYKRFRDAASTLEDLGRQAQLRFPRQAIDRAQSEANIESEPIRDVEIWDLIGAFGRILRERESPTVASIVFDDTPVTVYMERIRVRLIDQRRAVLSDLFAPGMHKSAMVGVFLAVLELARHHNVHAEQNDIHGEIIITPGDAFDAPLMPSDVTSV
jgi:segregation and condensation protein A